jgi:peptidoglycan hydrolase-like amidase
MKKIKKYSEFINEGYSNTDIKTVLLSHFDENKGEIKSKGMDFESMRDNLSNTLNSLDSNFLEKVTQDFSNVSNIEDKEEFEKEFERILTEISKRVESSLTNEGFIDGLKHAFSYLRDKIKQAVKWVSDRIFTISGLATIGLAAILFIVNQWGAGLGMSQDFANVTINAVLILGITAFKFGQKNDEYKQISEI